MKQQGRGLNGHFWPHWEGVLGPRRWYGNPTVPTLYPRAGHRQNPPLTGDWSGANCSAHCSASFQLLTGRHPKGVQRRAGNPGRQQTDRGLQLRQRHAAFPMSRCRLASALCCDSKTRSPRLHFSPARFNSDKEKELHFSAQDFLSCVSFSLSLRE